MAHLPEWFVLYRNDRLYAIDPQIAWLDIPSDDERSWKVPAGAERLDGGPEMVVFCLPNDARDI